MKFKRPSWREIIIVCLIYSVYATVTGWRYSVGGHIVRFVAGAGLATQTAEDLRDEIEHLGTKRLQSWAIDILERYRNGSVKTSTKPNEGASEGTLDLPENETPPYLKRAWLTMPIVSIRINHDDKTPECVVLSWGEYGALIGPSSYRFPEKYTRPISDKRTVIPGVYTYYIYHH
jgi:hypothetical protein